MTDHPHTFYLLCSYGLFAIAVIAELVLLARRRRRALQAIGDDEAAR